MIFAAAFLNGLVATLFVGAVARVVASFFSATRAARVAGFCVAIGFALERYSFSAPIGRDLALAASAFAGSMTALFVLWFWLLREAGTNEPEIGA